MKTVLLHIKISVVQFATFTGKNLLSVGLDETNPNFLAVVKKRFRGGVFDKILYPMSKVVAYSAGTSSPSTKDATIYATIKTEILLKDIQGEGVILENGIARIVDEQGTTHEINTLSNDPSLNISIAYPKFKEIEIDDEDEAPVRKRRPEKPYIPEKKKNDFIVRKAEKRIKKF